MALCFREVGHATVDNQDKAWTCLVIPINSSSFYLVQGGIPDYSLSLGITFATMSVQE